MVRTLCSHGRARGSVPGWDLGSHKLCVGPQKGKARPPSVAPNEPGTRVSSLYVKHLGQPVSGSVGWRLLQSARCWARRTPDGCERPAQMPVCSAVRKPGSERGSHPAREELAPEAGMAPSLGLGSRLPPCPPAVEVPRPADPVAGPSLGGTEAYCLRVLPGAPPALESGAQQMGTGRACWGRGGDEAGKPVGRLGSRLPGSGSSRASA